MKKLIYIFPLLFFSCNFKEDPRNSGFEEIPVRRMDALKTLSEDEPKLSKLLFSAQGIHPGWMVEFFDNKLVFRMSNEKENITLENGPDGYTPENIKDTTGYTFKSYSKTNSAELLIEITLENKTCTDGDTGEIKSRKVIVKYKNKTYTGCGEFEI